MNTVESKNSSLENPRSWFFFMRSIFPHFDAEYSFSYHKYEEYKPEMRGELAFGIHDDSLISISNMETFEKL